MAYSHTLRAHTYTHTNTHRHRCFIHKLPPSDRFLPSAARCLLTFSHSVGCPALGPPPNPSAPPPPLSLPPSVCCWPPGVACRERRRGEWNRGETCFQVQGMGGELSLTQETDGSAPRPTAVCHLNNFSNCHFRHFCF